MSNWHVGSKVPLNVYEGDRPVCQCHTAEDATRIVEAMNGSAAVAAEREACARIAEGKAAEFEEDGRDNFGRYDYQVSILRDLAVAIRSRSITKEEHGMPEIKAGPELDALIAEKVMEWSTFEGIAIPVSITALEVEPGRAHHRTRVWAADRNGRWVKMACEECGDMPGFSSDIAAAWQIVEKMHERGMWLKLTSPFNPDDIWNAGFTCHDFTRWNGRPDHSGQGENAALAICMAVLATVENKPCFAA